MQEKENQISVVALLQKQPNRYKMSARLMFPVLVMSLGGRMQGLWVSSTTPGHVSSDHDVFAARVTARGTVTSSPQLQYQELWVCFRYMFQC